MAVVHLSPEMPRISVRGHKREPSEPIDFLSTSYEEEATGELQRSYSGRPRSRSTSQALGANNGKQRKSLRNLGRAVSKTTKAKQGGEGGNRRSSASDADHGTTQQIDSAFTKIREQLVSKFVQVYKRIFHFQPISKKTNKQRVYLVLSNVIVCGRKGKPFCQTTLHAY